MCFSFWGISSPRPPTGAPPLDPAGGLPSARPPQLYSSKCSFKKALACHMFSVPLFQLLSELEELVFRERRLPPNASIIDNPVNPDFGLRTPGSGRRTVIRIVTKIELIGPWAMPYYPSKKFVKIRSQLFQLCDGETDRQTKRPK